MAKNTILAIQMQELDSAFLGLGDYSELTPTGGLGHSCFSVRIFNDCDEDIYVSYDKGVTNHDFVKLGSERILSFQAQSQPQNYTCLFPASFEVWVETVSGAAGVGFIYLSAYYQPN